jgi:hypothetical protein
MADYPELVLVRERKLHDLLPGGKKSTRWEASGVLVRDGHYYVAFDNRTDVGRIAANLDHDAENELVGASNGAHGYEGISYNPGRERYYLLAESREHSDGTFHAVVVEHDADMQHVKDRRVDFEFESENKGFEAVTHVERDGVDYLLALCEGNKCRCGKEGRKPGGGRIQLFERKTSRWRHVEAIALPKSVPFADSSGMSVDRGRVAVVSQVNSLLWVGEFNEAGWSWRDEGRLYAFPRAEDGAILYGNIEGVGWITPTRIVVVSDRRKKSTQPDKRQAEKDQSIHIFDVPA